ARVQKSDTRGLRRDHLEHRYCLSDTGPAWSIGRFKAALFYAYGMGWITFCGFTYVVDPGPAISAAPAACAAPDPAPQQESLISAGTPPKPPAPRAISAGNTPAKAQSTP